MRPQPGCAKSFDSLEANFRCLFAIGEEPLKTAQASLESLRRAVAVAPDDADLRALLGKALSLLSRFEPAQRELSRALEIDSAHRRARAWLGELHLLRGDLTAARRELDKAARPGADDGWELFFRAACAAAEGDPSAALADLKPLRASSADWGLASLAFSGLLWSSGGSSAEALKCLTEVVERRPQQAWTYALRAMAHQASGDYVAAENDLSRAVQLGPASWIHRERSLARERLGHIAGAIADMDSALELAGPQADLYERRAHLRICNRHYHLAVPDYTRTLELDPGRVRAYVGRATVHMIRDHRALALADIRKAEKLSGNDPALSLERIRFEIIAASKPGRITELQRLASRNKSLAAQAGFLIGCHGLKSRRYADAAAALSRAAADARGSDFALKIAYYLSVARSLDVQPAREYLPAGPKEARLVIVGLGIRPPYTATADALRAIASCDLVFNNLSEPEIGELLNLLAPRAIPTMFDVRGADARWTRSIFREVRPGRTVGFVTRGHPLVCGGLAGSLIRESQKQGTRYRVFGSVSSMDTLAVMDMPDELKGFRGRQALDYGSVFSPEFRMDTAVPAVLYFNSTVLELPRRHYEEFCSVLEKTYSPEHPCLFYGRNFNAPPDRIPLRGLRGHYGALDPSFTLLIPAR